MFRKDFHHTDHVSQAAGFTVVELLVVIVVVGILAAISFVAYNGVRQSAALSSLKAGLHSATNELGIDNVLSGAFPSSLSQANQGRGLTTNNGYTFEYTYDSSDNSYCLTARSDTSGVSSYHVTNTDTSPIEGACSGHNVSGNLLANGFGELGNNSGFSSLVYDGSDAPPSSQGSFVSPNGNYNSYIGNQSIPINKDKRYILRGWARQQTNGITTSRFYFGLSPYDADGHYISPAHYMYRPGTTTTLSQPLSPGDTVVHLEDISGSWYDTATINSHNRSLILWGYTDGSGYTWPPETYSRHTSPGDIYNGGVGAINQTNNTITLNKPWPGASFPAGTPISNGSSGGSYMYVAASNAYVNESWQEYVSPPITGTVASGLYAGTTSFPVSAKSVRVMVILNSGSPPTTSRQAISGIQFYEIGS